VILRLIQGVGVGGEWGGSVLLSMEWGKSNRRGFMASWPQLGVPIGLLLSTGLVKLFSATTGDSFTSWGWRIPFLLSIVLVGIGMYVRLRVLESPEFVALRRTATVVRVPVWESIRRYPRAILCSAFVRMSEQAPFYLFVTFVLTYGTEHLNLERGGLLTDTIVAAAIGLVSVPFFGWLSDHIGRRLMYGIGVVCTGLYAFPYFGLLNTKVAGLVLLGIVVSLLFHDMQYGPQAALIAERFGTGVRYSGASLGYQLASVIAGGPAPLIAAAILSATASSTFISWYIVGCAVVSMIALVAMPNTTAEAGMVEPAVPAATPTASA
jgi:MFS family permease